MEKYKGKRAIALVSGGLDSLVSLAVAARIMEVRSLLFFRYAQRSLERERDAVVGIASYYGLPLREIELEWMGELLPGPMSGKAPESAERRLELEQVWVPNRNGVFVNIAASIAEGYRCEYVVTGFNREEAVDFPDNRPEFVARTNGALALSTLAKVKVVSFTQDLAKDEILRLGTEISAPLSLVWSCYLDGPSMCGECPSCARLKEALESLPPDERPVMEFAD